jgi:hypothetical protein
MDADAVAVAVFVLFAAPVFFGLLKAVENSLGLGSCSRRLTRMGLPSSSVIGTGWPSGGTTIFWQYGWTAAAELGTRRSSIFIMNGKLGSGPAGEAEEADEGLEPVEDAAAGDEASASLRLTFVGATLTRSSRFAELAGAGWGEAVASATDPCTTETEKDGGDPFEVKDGGELELPLPP